MYRFHIKSMVLGIGIGIVITSFIGIIYSAGMESGANREKIIEATALPVIIEENSTTDYADNMKEEEKAVEDVFQMASNGDENQNNETPVPANEPTASTNEVQPSPAKPISDEVILKIVSGDTSETVADKLFALGVIDDAELFNNKMTAMKLNASIQVGEFKVNKGEDMAEVIRKICGQ